MQPFERMIPPGGEWLYLKLYGSPETENDLLTGPIAAFIEQLEAAEMPSDVFFLRYSDPEPHLRVRLRTPTTADAETALQEIPAFARSLMEHDLCSRFALDTYEREIERYGGSAAIEAVESLFVADSALVIGLLEWLKGAELTPEAVAAATALDMLDGIGVGDTVFAELTKELRAMRRDAGSVYRSLKSRLQRLADASGLAAELASPALRALLDARRAAADRVGRELWRLASDGKLTSPPADICQSLLHMHCNRLLGRDRAAEQKALGLMLRMRQARDARDKSRARSEPKRAEAAID
jgi:thiopeptide-type bacteriocin biosynthesis protein